MSFKKCASVLFISFALGRNSRGRRDKECQSKYRAFAALTFTQLVPLSANCQLLLVNACLASKEENQTLHLTVFLLILEKCTTKESLCHTFKQRFYCYCKTVRYGFWYKHLKIAYTDQCVHLYPHTLVLAHTVPAWTLSHTQIFRSQLTRANKVTRALCLELSADYCCV